MKNLIWICLFFLALNVTASAQGNDPDCHYTDSLRTVLWTALKKVKKLDQQMSPELEAVVRKRMIYTFGQEYEFFEQEHFHQRNYIDTVTGGGFYFSREFMPFGEPGKGTRESTPEDIRLDSLVYMWLALEDSKAEAEFHIAY